MPFKAIIAKQSPPIPVALGHTTAWTAEAAIAASTALPPFWRIFIASKLLKGLEKGSSGVISAVTNSTHFLARKVFDDFENKIPQTKNDQLIGVRETFDGYNLISALHSFHSIKDENYKNILPPLTLLSEQKLKELTEKLNKLKFISEKNLAA